MQPALHHIKSPAVSIVIPARNEESNLGQLLKSLAALHFPRERLEIIVIDHESTDRTAEVAQMAGAKVFRKSGGTISSARNFGAALSSAPILAFLDADCTVAEDWLKRALSYFSDPKVGAVGSYYVVPLERSTWVRRALNAQTRARPKFSEGKWLPAGNMLVRRTVYGEFGGFDESLMTCEDVDLCYRIARNYRVIEDTSIRCFHHGEPETLRQLFRKELWRGRDNLLGVLRHGLRWDELPSLILPIYTVASLGLLLLTICLAAANWWRGAPVLIAAALYVLPLLSVAIITGARAGDWRYVPQWTLMYGVYFLARGVAPLYHWRHV